MVSNLYISDRTIQVIVRAVIVRKLQEMCKQYVLHVSVVLIQIASKLFYYQYVGTFSYTEIPLLTGRFKYAYCYYIFFSTKYLLQHVLVYERVYTHIDTVGKWFDYKM